MGLDVTIGTTTGPPRNRGAQPKDPWWVSGLKSIGSAALSGLTGGIESGISGRVGNELAGRNPNAAYFSGAGADYLQNKYLGGTEQGRSQGQRLAEQQMDYQFTALEMEGYNRYKDRQLQRELAGLPYDGQPSTGQNGPYTFNRFLQDISAPYRGAGKYYLDLFKE